MPAATLPSTKVQIGVTIVALSSALAVASGKPFSRGSSHCSGSSKGEGWQDSTPPAISCVGVKMPMSGRPSSPRGPCSPCGPVSPGRPWGPVGPGSPCGPWVPRQRVQRHRCGRHALALAQDDAVDADFQKAWSTIERVGAEIQFDLENEAHFGLRFAVLTAAAGRP